MAASDARPVPRKNAAFRFYFSLRNLSTGALITTWTGADSEVSLDGAAFSDCTAEATEIGTTGCGYIDLTASEMNADAVLYKLTVTNTNAETLVVTFFPEESGDYRSDMTLISGDATAADNAESFFDGTGYAGTNNVIPTVTTVTTATNVTTVNGLAAGVITAASIAADAITDAKVASDVTIASVTGAVGSVTGNVGGNVTGSVGSVVGAINTGSGTITTLDALDTAQDTQHSTTQGSLTTVLARLGAWTGSGINTILGAFRALMAKASALTPTDISGGTTYDNTSDSLEALADSKASAADLSTVQSTVTTTSNTLMTVNNKLGAWAGSGTGDVLSAMRAIVSKTTTNCSDLISGGLTYDNTSDSLEAIRDRGDAAWTGGGGDPWDDALPGAYAAGTAGYILGNLSVSTGSGARTVTITVQLSAAAVEGATVRLTKAAETYLGTTNASGVVTFNVDDGTWTVAITAANATYAGTTIVVDGNETATYSMTAISVTPSSAPLRTGYLVCYDEDGVVESGAIVTLTCYYAPDTGYALDSKARSETSDVNGLVQFTNLIVGAKYRIKRGEAAEYRFTVAAGSGSFAISSIVGDDE